MNILYRCITKPWRLLSVSFFLSLRKVNFPNFLFLITFLLQRHNHTLFPNFRSYLLKSCYRRRNKDLYSQIFLLTKLLRVHLYPSARCYTKNCREINKHTTKEKCMISHALGRLVTVNEMYL